MGILGFTAEEIREFVHEYEVQPHGCKTLLFALPDFRVVDVTPEPDGGRRVLVESVLEEGCCPACGVMSGLIRDRPTSRIKDLSYGAVPLAVFVRKRRLACVERLCQRKSFTETTAHLPPRARVRTTIIGIEETRARSVRWVCEGIDDDARKPAWRRSDPWMTSIANQMVTDVRQAVLCEQHGLPG